jgi:ADP-heptose:LPS heptosyltransferase
VTFSRRLKRRAYAALHPLYRLLFPTSVASGTRVPRDVWRMLVVRNDRIGDLILTTPALDALRELAPGAEVDVLASRANARILEHDPRVTMVYVHDGTWRGLFRLRAALRARRYDVVFSPIPGQSIAQGVAASLASHRNTARVSVWRAKRYHGFFTHVVRTPRTSRMDPVSEHLVHVLRAAFGVPITGAVSRPSIAVPPEAHRAADAFIAGHALGTFVVVSLWSVAAARSWSVTECVRALGVLAAHHPSWKYVLVPAPRDAPDAERVRAEGPFARVFVYPPTAPLLEIVALTERAALVITPNTMTLHLAVATARPVVWLGTTADRTDLHLWSPVGIPARGLIAEDGAPASTIAGDDVAAAVESLAVEAGIGA